MKANILDYYYNSNFKKILDKKSLGLHMLTNLLFITTVYIKFFRNHFYFKHDRIILRKYWMIMLWTSVAFFFFSGVVILRNNFFGRYKEMFAYFLNREAN